MSFTEEQLLERRHYLGGSEAAAAVGRCPYFTPLELFRAKRGEGEPIEETIPMMVGTALEPVTLALLERQEGITVSRRQEVVVDRALSWRRATLDGIASDGGSVQAKASGWWQGWGKDKDSIPEYIIHQVQHEMACSGLTFSYVPVILSQREFRVYRIERDEEHIGLLTEAEIKFWERLQNNDPPPPANSDDLKLIFPTSIELAKKATLEIQLDAYELARVKTERKLLEKQEEELAFRIKNFLGDRDTLLDEAGRPLATFKGSLRNDIDVKRLRMEHPQLAIAYARQSVVRTLLSKVK